ncbi:MAG TPA: hypothetical protein VFC99_19610 [Acidimicrobiia bacterium]|nr:hypothetical protein [Acidimicrobiia bacterium]
MLRRLKWIVLLLVVVVVAGAVIAVLTTRPGLSDARDRVDTRWLVLRPSLMARYAALTPVEQALVAAGGPDRAVTRDLRDELARWKALAARSTANADPGAEALAANALEALARRTRANMTNGKLNGNQALTAALQTFDTKVPQPPDAVSKYNDAVRAYQEERSGTVHSAVASLLGYDERPQLVVGS